MDRTLHQALPRENASSAPAWFPLVPRYDHSYDQTSDDP